MQNIFNVLGFGWRYLRHYWGRLAAAIFFGFVFAICSASFVWATRTLTARFSPETSIPAIQKPATPSVTPFKEEFKSFKHKMDEVVDAWLPRASQKPTWQQALGIMLFFPLLVFARATADYLNNYCLGWVSERVIRDMRLDIMEKLSTLSLDFFTRTSTGELLTRINVDTANLLRTFRQGGADLIKESISMVAILIALLLLDWKLTLWAMILLPVCMFPLMVLGRKARKAMKASLKANVTQSSQLVELLGGIRIIKAFNLENAEISRFRKTSSQLVHAGMKGIQAKELINPILEVISMIGFSALLLYIFSTGRSGQDLVGFLSGILLFFLSVKKLAALHIMFEQAGVAVGRVREILSEKPKVVDIPSPKPLKQFSSNITFENVSFAYKDTPVLRDFSLSIPRGFRLGIVGESGSGKTTLVNLLFRFYDPTRGSIKIDGLDLREVAVMDLRQQMALVSQDVTLFDLTVAENIACGKPGASREEVEVAARAAFAHEFILQMPEGYDTRVGERGVTLSGGQRQRIAIARAFVRNAPILVLDEATAALDSKAEAEVQAAIDRLAEHRTVICVAHRLSTLQSMDGLIVLAEGRIIESGGFDELLKRSSAFATMAARQGIFPNRVLSQ